MTDMEKEIIKRIKSRVSKHYGKWVVNTTDVNWAIAKAMYGEKYGEIRGWETMTPAEQEKVKVVRSKMIDKGILRYSSIPHAKYRESIGKLGYNPFNMVLERKFWELFNEIKGKEAKI